MQLDSVLNLFGIESIPFIEESTTTGEQTFRNTTVSQRWIIQPKAETPMMNFNDSGVNQITTANGYSLDPTFASESVPRGMWHQFGNIPEDSNKGIFLEIEDIPKSWLRFHPSARDNNSVYNNQDASSNGELLYRNMKSLTDLMGFENSSVRLGELKDSQTIREAIVAVPYTLSPDGGCNDLLSQDRRSDQKEFFSIPKDRISCRS